MISRFKDFLGKLSGYKSKYEYLHANIYVEVHRMNNHLVQLPQDSPRWALQQIISRMKNYIDKSASV